MTRRLAVFLTCLTAAVGCSGSNDAESAKAKARADAEATVTKAKAAPEAPKTELAAAAQPQSTVAQGTLPAGETKEKKPVEQGDIRNSFSLQRPQIEWSDHANVHLHFIQLRKTSAEKPFFMVWTDARLYAGGESYLSANNIPPPTNFVNGDRRLLYGGKGNDFDREIKYSYEVNTSEQGKFTIASQTYDFANGALFLISAQDGDVRVKQLSRDPSKLPSDEAEVIAFGKSDPDINAFFSQSARSK